jgi:hypothetical protein
MPGRCWCWHFSPDTVDICDDYVWLTPLIGVVSSLLVLHLRARYYNLAVLLFSAFKKSRATARAKEFFFKRGA